MRFGTIVFFLLTLPILLSPANSFAGSEKTLHSFAGGSDGAVPVGALLLDAHGNLFGVTNSGGNSECNSVLSAGCGTVFALTPRGDGSYGEKVIHVFSQTTDGGQPLASPVRDVAGDIFGSTQYYGPFGEGVVWDLTPKSGGGWMEEIPHTFNNVNGGFYCIGLTLDAHGNLYGTTFGGGPSNDGVVFHLTQAGEKWNDSLLYNFAGGNDDGNAASAAVTIDAHGNLYGTTYEGGPHLAGTVFEMQRGASGGWTEQPIYLFTGLGFTGGADGVNPTAGVIFDKVGNLYGTTSYGGSKNVGAVYQLKPDGSGGWKESVIYTFLDGTDGGHPGGLIIDAAGNLYGTTSGHNTFGSVYKLSPGADGKWTFTVLYDFLNGADGGSPSGSLVRDPAGDLFGTAEFGGSAGLGVVYEITP
jgi:uncharacterized repeat protein (TIGR03803 family)